MTYRSGHLSCWLCALTALCLSAVIVAGCGGPSVPAGSGPTTNIAPPPVSPAEAEAKAFAANPFALPPGDVDALHRYVQRLAQWKSSAQSDADYRVDCQKWIAAMLDTTDKILAMKPTAEQSRTAAGLKLSALYDQAEIATAETRIAHEEGAYQYAKELAKSDDPDLAVRGRLGWLARQLRRVNEGREDESDLLAVALADFLASPQLNSAAHGVALAAARTLEMIERNELAMAAYRQVATTFATNADVVADDSGREVKVADLTQGAAAAAERRMGLIGQKFDLSATLFDKAPLDWSAYQGKVVLVHFWESEYGTGEIANLLAAYEKLHPQGFEVIGISLDKEIAHVRHYLEEHKLPWPIVFSHDQNAAEPYHPLAQKYGVNRLPLSVLIGKDGKVVTLAAVGKQLIPRAEAVLAAVAAEKKPDPNPADAKPDINVKPDAKPEPAPPEQAKTDPTAQPAPLPPKKVEPKPALDKDPADKSKSDELKLTGNPYLPSKRWTNEETADWLQQMREKPESVKQRPGFYDALIVGADRVLASDLNVKLKNPAILGKLEALHVKSLAEEKGIDAQIRELLKIAQDNQDNEVVAEVRFQSLEQRLLASDDLKPGERLPLLDEVEKFFAKQIPVTRHSRLASATVHIINNIEDDPAAKKQMKRFSPIFMKSKDQDLVRYGRKLGEAAEPPAKTKDQNQSLD